MVLRVCRAKEAELSREYAGQYLSEPLHTNLAAMTVVNVGLA